MMSSAILIRKATEGDAQAAWDIRVAAITSQCPGHYSADELRVWTGGELTKRFTEQVETSFHVATFDGRVVATGMLELGSGKIDAIFVDPPFFRSGIGRSMLAHLERIAFDAGLAQLSLDSTLNAAPFYRANGFVGDSVAKYDSPSGISLACVPMVKAVRRDT